MCTEPAPACAAELNWCRSLSVSAKSSGEALVGIVLDEILSGAKDSSLCSIAGRRYPSRTERPFGHAGM